MALMQSIQEEHESEIHDGHQIDAKIDYSEKTLFPMICCQSAMAVRLSLTLRVGTLKKMRIIRCCSWVGEIPHILLWQVY